MLHTSSAYRQTSKITFHDSKISANILRPPYESWIDLYDLPL